MAFAQVIPKLKKLFPPEITGLVVIMVGVALIPLGVSKFLGVEFSGDSIEPPKLIIACITLGVMIGLNLWGKGKIRLYGVSVFTCGFLGGVATDTSASNVGLSAATGANSRVIAWSAGLIFIIGISMIFGLSVDIASSLFFMVPSWLVPVFSSSLTVSTLLAVILNQIFAIREKKSENEHTAG